MFIVMPSVLHYERFKLDSADAWCLLLTREFEICVIENEVNNLLAKLHLPALHIALHHFFSMLRLGSKQTRCVCYRFITARRLSDDHSETGRPAWKPPSAVDDFLGINSDVGVTDIRLTNYDKSVPLKKYEHLSHRELPASDEKIYLANFGEIRFDSDNSRFETPKEKSNYIDEQYFGSRTVNHEDKKLQENLRGSFIEEQYFSTNSGNELKPSNNSLSHDYEHGENEDHDFLEKHDYERSGNFIEGSYFSKQNQRMNIQPDMASKMANDHSAFVPDEAPYLQDNLNDRSFDPGVVINRHQLPDAAKQKLDKSENHKSLRSKDSDEFGNLSEKINKSSHEDDSRSEVNEVPIQETKIEKMWRMEKEADKAKQSKTAFDYVLKRRKLEKQSEFNSNQTVASESEPRSSTKGRLTEKIDSKGFRILNQVTKDLDDLPEFMVLQLLRNSILYNENDIVALNKPYGLPIQPGAGHRHYLTKFIPELIKYVKKNDPITDLYTVHRLDKETTGVLLLAKTQKMASVLHDLFASGEIIKTYWALTKGVPSPMKGIVDIPMYESSHEGKSRMMLRVEYNQETKGLIQRSSRKCQQAITAYSVLSSADNAALVELKPKTGVKHQLRVHLASALGCPILGDHKYSHFLKLVPQKLPTDILQKLHIRQSKTRHLPMHLHARGIAIPEICDGQNIVIGARLSSYFTENMKRLKLHNIKGVSQ
ncbi:hypothetical protein CHUAL_013411 [Chamberlinius hualienensis]